MFKGLVPATMYKIQVVDQGNNRVVGEKNYRTLPGVDAKQVKMAVGGDIGIDQQATSLTEHLIPFNPDILIIGGDNAYDDGMNTCYYSWDSVYDLLDELNTKLNRIVPFIMTVGNHDVGFNALAGIKLNFKEPTSLPYYFTWNPQHTSP